MEPVPIAGLREFMLDIARINTPLSSTILELQNYKPE